MEARTNIYFNRITGVGGHVIIVLILACYLALLSAYILADILQTTKELNVIFAMVVGMAAAMIFEFACFFCAVNSYKVASWICCFASIIISRATFEDFSPDFSWSFKYFTMWVYSLFAPLLIAFLSHKIGEKMESEQPANNAKLNQLRECKKCGKEFEPATHNQKYCSEKCRKTNGVKVNGKKLVLN